MKIQNLLFILLASSCITRQTKITSNLTINYNKKENIHLSCFIKDYDIIRFSTSDSTLIGDISDIEIHDNYIVILDKINNNLQVYDHEGKFIHQLSKIGRGPGEYTYLNDIAINTQGIYLLDYSQQKIILYDFNFKHQKDFTFPFYASELAFTRDNIVIYSENTGNENNHQFYYTDNYGNIINQFLPRKKNYGTNTFISSNVFAQTDSLFILSPRFSNTFYTLRDTSIIPLFTLDFKDKTFPENQTDITKYNVNDRSFPYIVRRNIFISNNNLIVDYIHNYDRYFYIYNLLTHESRNGIIENDLIEDFRFFPRTAKNNKIIDWIDAASLLEYFPKVIQNHPLLSELKENDNHVLFIYNPK